jgi:hypothetical protein
MESQSHQVGTATAIEPPAQSEPQGSPRMLSPFVILPIIVVFGYVAFLLSGFGTGLSTRSGHDVRSLPLYAFFGFNLLLMQAVVSNERSAIRSIYAFLTSAFALFFVADVAFFNGDPLLVRNQVTYLVLNVLLFVIFVTDAVDRRRTPNTRLKLLQSNPYGLFASDFAGLAVLCFAAWALLNMLAGKVFGFSVTVDLSALHLPGIHQLQDADLVLALLATAVALGLLVIVGLIIGAAQSSSRSPEAFWRVFGQVLVEAGDQGLLSLRLVLSPLIWLIPATSLARLSHQVTIYLDASGHRSGQTQLGSIGDLFNPFSPSSVANYSQGLQVLALVVIAVLSVILAVALAEHSVSIVMRTLRIIATAGRAVALVLALFFVSLATINAAVILLTITQYTPFQLGAPILIALLAVGGLTLYSALRQRMGQSA